MQHKTAFLAALVLPASVAAHSGPHSDMTLLEGAMHFLGTDHVIGLVIAVAAAALLAFVGPRDRRAPRHTQRTGRNHRE